MPPQPASKIFIIPGINDDILAFFKLSSWAIEKKYGQSHNLSTELFSVDWLTEDAGQVKQNIRRLCEIIADQPEGTRVHLIGSSAGAVVALLCALQIPKAIESVTIFSGWLKITGILETLDAIPYAKIVKQFEKKYDALSTAQKKALGAKTLIVEPKFDNIIPDEARHLPFCQKVVLPFIEHFGISNLGLLYGYVWPGNDTIIGHSIQKSGTIHPSGQ